MGASGWSYFTPYHADVEQALQTLREQVFARGEFGQGTEMPPFPLDAPPELLDGFRQLKEMNAKRFAGVRTIQEALDAGGADGTHTILDIEHVSVTPGFAVAWEAPASAVRKVYGTDKPTHADIERVGPQRLDVALKLQRWQGVYVILYADNQPDEIYFEGSSGD